METITAANVPWIALVIAILAFAAAIVVLGICAAESWPSEKTTNQIAPVTLRVVPTVVDPQTYTAPRIYTMRLSNQTIVARNRCDSAVMTYVPPDPASYPTTGLDVKTPTTVLRGACVQLHKTGRYTFQLRVQPTLGNLNSEFRVGILHAIDDQVEKRLPMSSDYEPGTSTLFGLSNDDPTVYGGAVPGDENYTDASVQGQVYAQAGQILQPLVAPLSSGPGLNYQSPYSIPPVELLVTYHPEDEE
jgi:hypothetical protein